MESQFRQPKQVINVEVNKQSIARNFGIGDNEVCYAKPGQPLTGYKAIYDKATQRAYYLPTGLTGTVVSMSIAGVLTHSAGTIDLGALAVIREEFVTLPGSFSSGSTINVKNERLEYQGGLYRWDGVLPKVVPAGSTPMDSGGIGIGAWLGVGDTVLRGQISDPDGATYYPFLQIARWRDDGDIRGWGALPGLANATVTTAAINATYAARAGKTVKIPQVDDDGWYLDGTVNAGYSRTTTHAYGAKIFATFDGVMIDLNPDANPSAIDGANSKAYIKWFGGEFQCIAATIANSAAFRVYAIRQVTIEDAIFGNSGSVRLNSGIMIAGLGGHNILKNRFLLVNKGIDCPQWATNPADTAGPITTSNFIGNNFILTTGQKAFHVRGGWNRWLIQSGFVNGSGAETFHFTNYADCMGLNIIGVGFEQAVAGGKFIYLQDTSGRPFSSINISGSMFGGDPFAGGHVAIDLERCINVSIGDGTRVEGTIARNNFSVRCDANCQDIVIDPSCRLPGPGVGISMARAQISVGKTFQRISELNLSGYNGDAKSSGTVTLDMKTLMGNSYPQQLAPLAYDLIVQCRDSGSATSTTAQVEVSKNTGSATTRTIIDLRGVPNDVRVGGNVHVNAEADGSIVLVFTASGTGTLDVWVYVTAVYN